MTRRVLIDSDGRPTGEPAEKKTSAETTPKAAPAADDPYTPEERAYFTSKGTDISDGLLSQYGLEKATETGAEEKATGEGTKTPAGGQNGDVAVAVTGDGATAPGFSAEAAAQTPLADEHFSEEDLDGATADADGRIRDSQGRFVPLAALVQSRARFREQRDRSAELERRADEYRDKAAKAEASLTAMREVWDERARQLEAARTQRGGEAGGAAPKEEAVTEPPNPEEDIFGYVKWQSDQIGRLTKAVEEASKSTKEVGERTAAQITERDMIAGYRTSATVLAQREPNFAPAYAHLINARHQELEFHGVADPNERASIISAEERQLVQQAYAAGKDPAVYVYGLAQLRGFVPQATSPAPQAGGNGAAAQQTAAPAAAQTAVTAQSAVVTQNGARPAATAMPTEAERLASQARAQAATPTLSNSGASSDAGVLTPESIANMTDAEFSMLYDRIGKARMAELMGRG